MWVIDGSHLLCESIPTARIHDAARCIVGDAIAGRCIVGDVIHVRTVRIATPRVDTGRIPCIINIRSATGTGAESEWT